MKISKIVSLILSIIFFIPMVIVLWSTFISSAWPADPSMNAAMIMFFIAAALSLLSMAQGKDL